MAEQVMTEAEREQKEAALLVEHAKLSRQVNEAVWKLNIVHGYLDAAVLAAKDLDTDRVYGVMLTLEGIMAELSDAVDMPNPAKESL